MKIKSQFKDKNSLLYELKKFKRLNTPIFWDNVILALFIFIGIMFVLSLI